MTGDAQTMRAAALVASSIRAHDEDEAADRAKFFASAARGRPILSDEFGRGVILREGGFTYPFRVFRTGPTTYRVNVMGRRLECALESDGRAGARLVAGAGTFAVEWDEGDTVEVDGLRFGVARDDRGTIRAPVPAVVVAIRVEPGRHVEMGDPLIVLEVMKMEMSICAPRSGWVRRILVGTNVQVDVDEPLLQLTVEEEERPGAGEPARFDALVTDEEPASESNATCRTTLEELRRLMLGFDADPSVADTLGGQWSAACGGARDDVETILREEDEILGIFADVVSLSGRTIARDEAGAQTMRAHEEELLTYLRYLDGSHPSLSGTFLQRLRMALAHYEVRSLDRSPELEDGLYRLARSHQWADRQVPAVLAILDRRLEQIDDLRPLATQGFHTLLDHLTSEAGGRYLAVSDLAREVRYRFFDQPMLEEVRRRAYTEVEENLSRLESDPWAPNRDEQVRALVECPQPLKPLLTERMQRAGPATRAAMLEALARRYYRIRDLRDIHSMLVDDRPAVTAHYPHEGVTVHLVATQGDKVRMAETATLAAKLVHDVPQSEDVVVDLYLWREGFPEDPDRTAAEIAEVLGATAFGRPLRRVVVALSGPGAALNAAMMEHFTFRPSPNGYREEKLYRGLHPMIGKRLDLWRLSNFWIDRLPSVEDVYLFRGVARENPKDERLFALAEVRDLTQVRDPDGRLVSVPGLELMLTEALEGIRLYQSHRPPGKRLQWNRVLLYVWPPFDLPTSDIFRIVHKLAPLAERLGLEKVVVRARMPDEKTRELRDRVVHISNPVGRGFALRFDDPADRPIRPLSEYMQKVVQTRQRGLTYPYEIIRMLTPPRDTPADFPPGEFIEFDFDDAGTFAPVERPYGQNKANMVSGVITNYTDAYPEGMKRVVLLGDPSRSLGSLAEPECARIIAALDLAERMHAPLEWFAVSAGAKISMSSGTENMDWIGRVLRRLIEFTQGGGEVNVIVCGINVGAQPYWNAEATMLMHTKGILIMTPDGAMVLTGKQALDYSGGVSAEDNVGIGGYDRVMGPNGQAQYWATDLDEACRTLLQHYDHTYVSPGERFPRRIATADPFDRDVCDSPHRPEGEGRFGTIGDVFSEVKNPGRKQPFDIRSVMRAAIDQDHRPLERWRGMSDAEIAVVWDAHLGGRPVCMLGIESRPLPRHEVGPTDGPDHWTSGTLFPLSSKKIARAINSASGNRPVVVLANLSGFDGSPESLRNLQLEYGAEIGRAVTNFKGPMVFCVISRYHGGAFVVFSKTLNENLEIAAVEGSFASVIGGAPAAAVVFSRDVDQRTKADARVQELQQAMTDAEGAEKSRLRTRLADLTAAVRSEKLGEVAAEFDNIHTIYRAREMGSVDTIISPSNVRPYLIDAVERGILRELARTSAFDAAEQPVKEPVLLEPR